MIMAIGVLILSVVVFKLDFPSVKNSKSKQDRKKYIGVFAFAFVLFMLFTLDFTIPNPLDWIKKVYEPIMDPFNKSLEKNRIL
jgi:uncharacterized membrane protein YadS